MIKLHLGDKIEHINRLGEYNRWEVVQYAGFGWNDMKFGQRTDFRILYKNSQGSICNDQLKYFRYYNRRNEK